MGFSDGKSRAKTYHETVPLNKIQNAGADRKTYRTEEQWEKKAEELVGRCERG
jgi:hypothetical protein